MATWKPAKQRGTFYVRASFGSGKTQRRPSATIKGTTRTIDRLAAEWEERERAKWLDELANPADDDDAEPSAPTLSSVWGELIAEASTSWAPKYRDDHVALRHETDVTPIDDAGRVLGEIPIAELSRLDVSAYLSRYAATPIPGDKLPSDRSIMRRLKAIREAINYAIDTGRLAGDPTRKMRVPRGRFIEERDIPKPAELDAKLRAACARLEPSKRYLDRGDRAELMAPICSIAIWLGLRKSEILGLRFRDVDVIDGIVKVRRAVVDAPATQGGYRIKATKNEQRREVPLPPVAAQIIGARRLALETELARNDVQTDVGEAFVFSSTFGQHPIRPSSLRSWWLALRQVEPELDRINFKDARTSHSRKLNRRVGNRGIAAAHMGHGEDVNRQHYDGRDPGDLEIVRDAIEGLLDD